MSEVRRTVGSCPRYGKLTGCGRAAGRPADASPQEPQYEVRSEKSGGTAVHKPQALPALSAQAGRSGQQNQPFCTHPRRLMSP
ncbi:DUF2945 domain-containing protein [Streptomyces sp. IBSBF 2435]|uniref:DUF2945 domain-containing protein n=1 Tax=Streptomyces sp. IBSBF 2435 TaxID=2903531 RepID=UPI002FDC3282